MMRKIIDLMSEHYIEDLKNESWFSYGHYGNLANIDEDDEYIDLTTIQQISLFYHNAFHIAQFFEKYIDAHNPTYAITTKETLSLCFCIYQSRSVPN